MPLLTQSKMIIMGVSIPKSYRLYHFHDKESISTKSHYLEGDFCHFVIVKS